MSRYGRFCLVAMVLQVAMCLAFTPIAASAEEFTVFPENNTRLTCIDDAATYFDLTLMGWGPNWAWANFRGTLEEEADNARMNNTVSWGDDTARVEVTSRVRRASPRAVEIDLEVRAARDTELHMLIAAIELAPAFRGGHVTTADADGKEIRKRLPLDKQGVGREVSQFAILDAAGRATSISLDPPGAVESDGAIRIVLADGRLTADQTRRTRITIELPGNVNFFAGPNQLPSDSDMDSWYTFAPDADHARPSEIGMQDWLERPAGKHGRITRDGDALVYNGRPIKLWGLNLCFAACAPPKDLAERQADFYAKYGINAVRLHKFGDGAGWAGILAPDSFTEYDPQGLDRMDYLIARLKQRGIFVKLSAHFGSQKLGPADRETVPYLEEFGSFAAGNGRVTTPHSAVHYSPELQKLQALQMTNLLRHKNPYTGLTYAEDPCIAFIEIINEQSILFYTSMSPLKASPTLRQNVATRFCDWLRAKYGDQPGLVAAWGERALDSFTDEGFPAVGESLDRNNVLPLGNPWYFDPVQLAGGQAFRRQRLLDTMTFLHELQNEFYAGYERAMREVGYEGEIVASNWQAGRAMSHLYNLHSDALLGTIDRHNYFGGGEAGRIDNSTMLAAAGSGMLSSGMQQVINHPYMLSEWIHVRPNEWGVEGPAVIGAYGLGLQDWDVSFMFQNRDSGRIDQQIESSGWNVTAPNVIGVFPAVARQVLRGDVARSELSAPCYVHVPSLAEGKVGFDDRTTQQHDVKSFETDKVPAAALAVVRCGVEFTDTHRDTPAFDITPHFVDGAYQSSTGELRWRPGQSRLDGHFTINTPATKAVVGFAQDQVCLLGNVAIKPASPYAAIYVTAQEPDRDIATSDRLLIVAIARARNTGMRVYNGDRILARGASPVVMEPVRARVALRKAGAPTVHVLDHAGHRTGRTLPIRNGVFEIDGARDQTCYYLVTYDE